MEEHVLAIARVDEAEASVGEAFDRSSCHLGLLPSVLSFVDADLSTVEGRAVHLTKGVLSVLGIDEGDEAEASRATGLTVQDDLGVRDIAKAGECLVEAGVVGIPAEPSYEEFVRHDCVLGGGPRSQRPPRSFLFVCPRRCQG